MQYTHKIARRLALSRPLAFASCLMLGACQQDQTDHFSPGSTLPEHVRIEHLLLAKPSHSPTVNQSIKLEATGRTRLGEIIPVAVEWKTTGGRIDSTGLFSAAAPGTYTVFAYARKTPQIGDSTPIIVRPKLIAELAVSPATAVVAPGGRQLYTASVELWNGVSSRVTPNWTTTGGTVSAEGVYRAPDAAGNYLVIAQFKSFADTAHVTVSSSPSGGTPVGLELTPNTITLETGTSQAFTTAAILSDGKKAPVTPTYSSTGGTITPEGLYTAGSAAGKFRVVATAHGKSDTAAVTVATREVPLEHVALAPASATLAPGGTQRFSATGRWGDGRTEPVAVTYNVTGGVVTPDGVYTAGTTPGTFRVIATAASGPADTAAVTITAAPATLQRVVLSPASVSLPVGRTQQFTASGQASDGATMPVTVTFVATGGTVTSGGMYTAGQVTGAYSVVARTADGSKADTSQVTISALSTTGQLSLPADSFVNTVGAATHFNYTNTVYVTNYPMVKARLVELGIRHIRDGGWNAGYYQRINDLAANGIKTLQVCDPRDVTPANCHALVKANLLNAVSGVEGPNEYDISSDPNWVTTLRNYHQARATLFRGDPSTAGIPLIGTAFVRWEATTQAGDLSAWNDRSNMHPLRFFPPDNRNQTTETVETEVEHRDTPYGEKPMMASETGYPTCIPGDGISERAQGKYVPRFYLAWFLAGVRRTYVYEFIDEGRDPHNCEASMGIVRNDGTPKPAFTTLKNLVALLKDPGPAFAPGKLDYTVSGDQTNVRRVLFQKRDGRFYLVIWQAVPSYNVYGSKYDISVPNRSLTLSFPTPVRGLKVYRPGQQADAISVLSSTVSASLAVPDEPLVIEVTP